MNRSLKLSMLLALALGSSQAAALELGQIQVKSALGQPLLAEIPVNPGSPAELQNLTARLASAEDAAQAGVAAGPTIPLQFSVVDGSNGRKIIRITSAQPVNDPYLDLLVEVNNATGKSLREFTILLDPPNSAASVPATLSPTQAPAKASRRAAAPAAASSTAQAAAPAPAAEPKSAKPAPAPRAAAASGSLPPVERGQTLSAIAHETAPEGVDLNQMLLALKQANPDAFYRDNINALKTGAVLRVPSKDDAQATAVAAAAAEVMRQNSDWRSGAARTPTTVADAGTRANASSAPTTKAPAGDHLALVPAKEGSDNAAGRGSKGDKSAKAEQGMNALHQDLLRSQEALTTLQQQGDELKSRLKDLEDINGKNERLLALKDNEIAELQHKLADARKAAGQPAAAASAPAKPEAAKPTQETMVKANEPAAASPAAAASAPTTAAAPVSAAPQASEPASASTATAATPVPAPVKPEAAKPVTPKPAASKPAAIAEEDPWYMQTWAWAAGAGAALVLLLLALRGRSRKAVPAAGAASSLADRFGTVPPINTDSLDPDQDELLDQLAEHPDDIGLHLELVSLYYSRRDVEHFEAAAEAMHAHVADPQQAEWQEVVRMGEDLVPEHPLFSHGAPLSSHGDEHDALDHFDLDRYADEKEAATPPPMPSSANKKVSEYHFDFDLTPRPVHNHAHASASAPADAVVEEKLEEEELQLRASSWEFAEPADELPPGDLDHAVGQFSDDPVDTKLDLARAYLDMGDPDGAQAMLEEVMHEGTQMQKDVAKRLLDSIH
ncbi:MAG TPA: FimV/HubP family polar landmark protein [Dyella sp.]|uniref:FimV/HubP family polar landmark protein n=1 Tax=Dyella sp. TaxID=1869338 RepID=UPI002D7A1BA6|nr:FimV/HubP family polar landmark protein [Dyella sp.]HET6554435.1 FimV/HubP family polar landmark protein [Dyella sp.]